LARARWWFGFGRGADRSRRPRGAVPGWEGMGAAACGWLLASRFLCGRPGTGWLACVVLPWQCAIGGGVRRVWGGVGWGGVVSCDGKRGPSQASNGAVLRCCR
jgi:hypothetical protein